MSFLSPAPPREKIVLKKSEEETLVSRLCRPKTLEWERREKERIKHERETLTECTFTPNVNRDPPIFADTEYVRLRSQVPFHERVLLEHLHKEDRLNQIRSTSSDTQQLMFTPKISDKSRAMIAKRVRPPVHERVQLEMKEKKEKLKKLKEQVDSSMETLSTSSSALNDVSPEELVQRLRARAKEQELKKEALKRTIEMERSRDVTFTPRINDTSRILASDAPSLLSRPPSRSRHPSRNQSILSDLTFRPKIDQKSVELLKNADHPSVKETPEERSARLYQEQKLRDEKRRQVERMMEERRKEAKPQICEISKLIAPSSTVDDLSNDRKRQVKQENLKRKIEAEVSKECTFKPQIGYTPKQNSNPYSLSVQNPEILSKKIENIQTSRQRKVEHLKRLQTLQEESACSFKPRTNSNRRGSFSGPAPVRGFESFVKRQHGAIQAKEDDEKYRARMFYQDIHERPFDSTRETDPQPFPLSGSHMAVSKRTLELSRELGEEMKQQCTFEPYTNEKKKRELAEYFLSQHVSS
ncbi:hypothetical protein RCL1_006150 [Eukaryota sp. TZLM3-RCL]